jgi:hypothetical protein
MHEHPGGRTPHPAMLRVAVVDEYPSANVSECTSSCTATPPLSPPPLPSQGNYLFFDKQNNRVGMIAAPNCNPNNAQPVASGQCAGASVSAATNGPAPSANAVLATASLLALLMMP